MAPQIAGYINNDLPRHAGKIAVDHFKENFIKGGFVDTKVDKWKLPKRYNAKGKYAGSRYGTLLSARKELYNSITYDARRRMVIIRSDKPYAKIHNEGGQVDHSIPVTPAMRRFAWAMHYNETGGVPKAQSKWKGLALTKRESIRVKFTMPKRQFIGNSAALNAKIEARIINDLKNILR
ncbi:MAG: phage virion morphogenesis protein [Bacteroidales bacterium]|nr:phage virion morphogenesis protein [Bacteroidales bacterium]